MNREPRLAQLALLVPLTLGATLGCRPNLGPCDEAEATTLVFDRDGYPAYAGQALVQLSCGNGAFCHSSGIPAFQRVGAPNGLDFDMVGSRTESESSPDSEALDRLMAGRSQVFDWRFDVYEWVEDGTMPPGEAGEQATSDDGGYVFEDGSPLPSISSEDGQLLLRRWLACGSPVVAATADPSADRPPGSSCADNDVGACIVRDAALLPDPTWSSIYELLIEPRCVSCHGPGPASLIDDSQLDLRDARTAYDALVGVDAAGSACGSAAESLVVGGDADASVLIHKLRGQTATGDPACGDVMPPPPATGIPAEVIDVVRQWIDDGAADN